jgi:hypothetical protein
MTLKLFNNTQDLRINLFNFRILSIIILLLSFETLYSQSDSIKLKIDNVSEYKCWKRINLTFINLSNQKVEIIDFHKECSNICDSTFTTYELLPNIGVPVKTKKPCFWYFVYKKDTLVCYNREQDRWNGIILGSPIHIYKSSKDSLAKKQTSRDVLILNQKSKVSTSILIYNAEFSNLMEVQYDFMIRFDGFVSIGNKVMKIKINTNRFKYKFKPGSSKRN